ncbi:hypothetical protein CDL12_27460 [Handroanthus impetiginosus]|uniref:RING-type E3 ubiquitin transferase n=1 Tax=Handroanthus impetiginosus TaxID=429701 RepID=A0A2G9G3Z0_9LAMI|nr:hypothetical protein CDL12_27460 [Handroanthus impetiginosus]
MVNAEDPNKSPKNVENPSKKQPENVENGQKNENLFSPRFRSVAAMAGWDEEALLIASLIVEDTPDRQFKHKKRSDLQSFKTPPTSSRRKRRAQRRSPAPIPVTVLDLDEDESKSKREIEKKNKEADANQEIVKNKEDDQVNTKGSGGVPSSTHAIPCIDRLREELSCAICLEICYEPSTTPCGHSFCKKCLRSAADKCGKRCPKCRQLISNGRYCTVNTVLWNTIQLLFPQEVEARKAAAASSPLDNQEPKPGTTPARTTDHNTRNRAVIQALLTSRESESTSTDRRNRNHHRHRIRRGGDLRTRTEMPSQNEDAALALRLQREEFMEAHRVTNGNSFAVARANLRAMASRAINIRIRGRTLAD